MRIQQQSLLRGIEFVAAGRAAASRIRGDNSLDLQSQANGFLTFYNYTFTCITLPLFYLTLAIVRTTRLSTSNYFESCVRALKYRSHVDGQSAGRRLPGGGV